MKDELLKLALMWERHAREYAADVEDVGNGLSDELRQDHRVREAMCRHHASQLRRTLAAQHEDARGGWVGEVTLPAPHRAYVTDDAVVVTGSPQQGWDEEGDSAHNCDANGCGQAHVLYRLPFTDERTSPEPPTAATTDAGREDAIPPEATEVFPSALNGGTALAGDWAIPRAPGINRIVDARMAYGWNECRKEMMRRLTPAGGEDGARLDWLAREYWRLDPFDMPTGGGDADVGWRVVQYHGDAPRERTVAEVYTDDPRAAIDAAIAAERGAGEG
jgi:hypothetical protein